LVNQLEWGEVTGLFKLEVVGSSDDIGVTAVEGLVRNQPTTGSF